MTDEIIELLDKSVENVSQKSDYEISTESMTIQEKMKILDDLGKPELIELFKDWKPRPSRRKKSAPLDQRVTITVTKSEKEDLEKELEIIKKDDSSVSISKLIRSRAMGNVDINGWKEIATKELKLITGIEDDRKELNKRKLFLSNEIEQSDDDEDIAMYDIEIKSIVKKLEKLKAKNVKRNVRLTGRMSLAECENIKWRAERLCISSSDYLRFMIFGLEPASDADAHMTIDSRKRFYVSIIDVANNGWGHPENVFQCTQCANYLNEVERLRDRIKQLENFI